MATSREVLLARGGVCRTFKQYMLDSLNRLAAGAGDLFRGVEFEESLGVFTYEGMSGDDPI